jgi:anthranilate phosphoribosyltransferase
MTTLRDAVHALSAGRSIGREGARASVEALLSPEASPALAAAWLVALRMKGETSDELAGVVDALRGRSEKVTIADAEAIDTCGTGGDGASTFNISTAVAFVVAGAGVTVAKHGNRAVRQAIDEERIGFLFAQRHHPAMRHVGPVRRELGLRTVFNLAGPLSNPAGVTRQLVGVYDAALVEVMARALAELGARSAWVVHGEGGLDELSLAGGTQVAALRDGEVHSFTVSPEDAGVARAPVEAIGGGDPAENAKLLRSMLEGERGPRRDAVVLNTAAALVVAGRAGDLREGAAEAARSLDSGAALGRLEALVKATGDGGAR